LKKNCVISKAVLLISDEIWNPDAYWPSELMSQKNQNIKSKTKESHHFENENSHLPF